MPLQDCNESPYVYWEADALAIQYATDNGANIISMSWGNVSLPNIIENAVNYAYGKGVFLCAAAGNNNNANKFYPAAFENVTAVAATDHADHKASFSNYGEWVDIAAPGKTIYSTMPTYHVLMNDWYHYPQNYSFGNGTSFASPMVAGVAALLLSKDPSLTPNEIKTLLCGNVDPYTSTYYIGTGRLNAQKALAALELSGGFKIKGGLGVSMVMTNNGTANLTNVTWQIQVKGGMLGLINKTVNGTVDIKAGESKTVSTGMLLGLGGFNIGAWVAGVEKKAKGTQFIIFSMVKK
jgi:subtilisin family serine protease